MNPILNAMMSRPHLNDIMGMIQAVKGNPSDFFERQMESNPQFRKFVEDNKDKTPEQIASDYGVDFNMVRQFLR